MIRTKGCFRIPVPLVWVFIAPQAAASASPFTLAANTDCWFVLSDLPIQNGIYWLSDTAFTAPSAASGYSHLRYQVTADSGDNWFALAVSKPTVRIDVDAVPEPSRALLALVGLSSIGLRRRPSHHDQC